MIERGEVVGTAINIAAQKSDKNKKGNITEEESIKNQEKKHDDKCNR